MSARAQKRTIADVEARATMSPEHDELARAIIATDGACADSTPKSTYASSAARAVDAAIERAQSVVASLQDSIRLAQALSDEIAREHQAQSESHARQSALLVACVDQARRARATTEEAVDAALRVDQTCNRGSA